MADENVEPTQEQKDAAAKAEAEKNKPIELTEEQEEAIFVKRFGVGSKELIKKEQQIVVLTDAEKAEQEEKKNQDSLKVALEKNWVKKKDYDDYLAANATDKIQIARKKFIEDHPELGEKAGAKFDKIYMLDAEDELEEGEGESAKFVPNEDKKIAMQAAAKLGEEIVNSRFASIKEIPKRHESYLEETATIAKNTELATKAILDIPREVEYKIGERVYKYKFTEEDFQDAQTMVLAGDHLKDKNLTAQDVKNTAARFLQAKNLQNILEEVEKVAYQTGVDETERSKSGIVPDRKDPPGSQDEKMAFAKKYGLIPAT